MNSLALSGNLVDTPELRKTQDGTSVANFRLGVRRPHSDTTDFFSGSCWGQAAEYLGKYAKRGDKIEVTGFLQTREYTDKNGVTHKLTEIKGEFVSIVWSKKGEERTEPEQAAPFEEIVDDDLPL